jgi:hypothetical protein
VAAKREQRVLLAEAQTAVPATVVVTLEPEEVLLGAMHDANATLQAVKGQLYELRASAGVVNPALLVLIGDWLDRVARIGKIIVDGEIADKLERRIGWVAQDRAATVWGHLASIVEASPLSAQQKLVLWESRFDGLQLVADGRAPFRLSGDEVHRFTAELQVAAEAERAAADGWLESEPEPDADAESGGGVPYLFAVDGSGNGLSGGG